MMCQWLIFFFSRSRVLDLLARCQEVRSRVRHRPRHPAGPVALLADQRFRLLVVADSRRNHRVQNLQDRHGRRSKDIRRPSVQVSASTWVRPENYANEQIFFREILDIDLTLQPEKAQNIAGVAVTHINAYVAELRRLFLVEDLVDSLKFALLLWLLTYIGAIFNGMTVVILCKLHFRGLRGGVSMAFA